MFLVGLTGGVATGKSTVSGMLMELGVPVIDADLMARRVLEPGTKTCQRVAEQFPGVVDPQTRQLDRAKLRKIIFEDEKERKKLDGITHPAIYREMVKEALKWGLRGYPYVVLDLPLLLEAGVMVDYIHKIVVVTCEPDLQLQRLMEQRRLTERESTLMINAQMPLHYKEKKADYVIENSGSISDTQKQVKEIHSKYLSTSYFHWKIRFYMGTALVGFCGVAYYLGKTIWKTISTTLTNTPPRPYLQLNSSPPSSSSSFEPRPFIRLH